MMGINASDSFPTRFSTARAVTGEGRYYNLKLNYGIFLAKISRY